MNNWIRRFKERKVEKRKAKVYVTFQKGSIHGKKWELQYFKRSEDFLIDRKRCIACNKELFKGELLVYKDDEVQEHYCSLECLKNFRPQLLEKLSDSLEESAVVTESKEGRRFYYLPFSSSNAKKDDHICTPLNFLVEEAK
jgi:Fe-S-cluster-containing dehydrogenase component